MSTQKHKRSYRNVAHVKKISEKSCQVVLYSSKTAILNQFSYQLLTLLLSIPLDKLPYLFTRWKGSVFKLIYHDFLMFIFLYAMLSIFYRYVFYTNDYNRQLFEVICFYMNGFSKLIPIAFLTGFYVSSVVSRWWDQFMTLPWPDKLALKLVNFCPGAVSNLEL